MTFPTDQILYRVTQGDETAFAQLCGYFNTPAFKFCTALLKDQKDAENVINSVFEQIWAERQQLNIQNNFQSYLFGTIKNQVFEQLVKCNEQNLKNQYLERMQSFGRD